MDVQRIKENRLLLDQWLSENTSTRILSDNAKFDFVEIIKGYIDLRFIHNEYSERKVINRVNNYCTFNDPRLLLDYDHHFNMGGYLYSYGNLLSNLLSIEIKGEEYSPEFLVSEFFHLVSVSGFLLDSGNSFEAINYTRDRLGLWQCEIQNIFIEEFLRFIDLEVKETIPSDDEVLCFYYKNWGSLNSVLQGMKSKLEETQTALIPKPTQESESGEPLGIAKLQDAVKTHFSELEKLHKVDIIQNNIRPNIIGQKLVEWQDKLDQMFLSHAKRDVFIKYIPFVSKDYGGSPKMMIYDINLDHGKSYLSQILFLQVLMNTVNFCKGRIVHFHSTLQLELLSNAFFVALSDKLFELIIKDAPPEIKRLRLLADDGKPFNELINEPFIKKYEEAFQKIKNEKVLDLLFSMTFKEGDDKLSFMSFLIEEITNSKHNKQDIFDNLLHPKELSKFIPNIETLQTAAYHLHIKELKRRYKTPDAPTPQPIQESPSDEAVDAPKLKLRNYKGARFDLAELIYFTWKSNIFAHPSGRDVQLNDVKNLFNEMIEEQIKDVSKSMHARYKDKLDNKFFLEEANSELFKHLAECHQECVAEKHRKRAKKKKN